MRNPWETIDLDIYENHMKLDTVMQLQALNEIMCDQFFRYDVKDIMILGIAGGNGLEHIDKHRIKKVYGVDINNDYLNACVERYPNLKDTFVPICTDLQSNYCILPHTELVVANLLIEYIGYKAFQRVINKISPNYVSCTIQINKGNKFVSDSPYLHVFDRLNTIHNNINELDLTLAMSEIDFFVVYKERKQLPNGKELHRIDYKK